MPEAAAGASLASFNALTEAEARSLLTRCCGASRWVDGMVALRPFTSAEALFAHADTLWLGLSEPDFLEAFAHHPEIGASLDELRQKFARTAELSQDEQAGVDRASEATLQALRNQNRAYRQRFGHSFIVCASGKSAAQMLAILEARLGNAPGVELAMAAAEQAKITRLRLEKLLP